MLQFDRVEKDEIEEKVVKVVLYFIFINFVVYL